MMENMDAPGYFFDMDGINYATKSEMMLNSDTLYLMNTNAEPVHPAYNWKNRKILIVEDDYVNYLFFHEILSPSFACLIRAVSMQEAMDMLTSNTRFDLVIINISIPGNEECRSLKRIRMLWPHMRVIALSGPKECRESRRNQAGCCDAVISHHLDSTEIRNVVNELFLPVN